MQDAQSTRLRRGFASALRKHVLIGGKWVPTPGEAHGESTKSVLDSKQKDLRDQIIGLKSERAAATDKVKLKELNDKISKLRTDRRDLRRGITGTENKKDRAEKKEAFTAPKPTPLTEAKIGAIEKAMRASKIAKVEPMKSGGKNEALKLTFEKGLDVGDANGGIDGTRAVYKPEGGGAAAQRLFGHSDVKSLDRTGREALAYEVDRAMGFNMTPPTVVVTTPEHGRGSAQAFVKGQSLIQYAAEKGRERYSALKDFKDSPELHKLAALDYVLGAGDRRAGNFMIDRGGRFYAIDNTVSFPRDNDKSFFKSWPSRVLAGRSLHPDVKKLVDSIDENKVLATLKGRGFKEGEEAGVISRIRELKTWKAWKNFEGPK